MSGILHFIFVPVNLITKLSACSFSPNIKKGHDFFKDEGFYRDGGIDHGW